MHRSRMAALQRSYWVGRLALSAVVALATLSAPSQAEDAATARLTGQLLVAADSMPDPRFAETVIYMVTHDANGALGLVVNRPIGDIPLAKLTEGLGAPTEQDLAGAVRTHYGGPVEPLRVFLLLPPPDGSADVPAVLTRRDEVLRAIGDGAGGDGPRDPGARENASIFVLGYAGWGPGQLEAEIGSGDWHTIPFDAALVFSGDFRGMWTHALERRGIDL